MRLNPSGSNQTVVSTDNGAEVLFSYRTPVAAFIPGRGYVRTKTRYSVTTSKHINQWLGGNANRATEVEQSELDSLL